MSAVRLTFADNAERDSVMTDLALGAASKRGTEAVFTAYDPETGKPAVVAFRPHGERAIDIEVVRE